MPSEGSNRMGSRFLKKNSKPLKPEPLNLRLLEEPEEDDNLDLLLNRRREIVKVSLTGLGDVEGKEDIAVLDRVNKFLLTPEKAPVNTSKRSLTLDSDICTQRENGMNFLNKSHVDDSLENLKDQTPSFKDSDLTKMPGKEKTKKERGKHGKDASPEEPSKGFYPSLGHCLHKVIYVKEAVDKLDTLHMAPTLVVKSIEDADHFKEHYNNDTFNWRRDIPVCVSDDENSEVFDFHVRSGSNKISLGGYKQADPPSLMGCSPVSDSSSSDSSQSKNTKYVVIQGERNRLTPMPQPLSNKQKKSRSNGSRDIKKGYFAVKEDHVPYTKDIDKILSKNCRIFSAPYH
ncbi:uncharacterized protein LOC133173323 [Saccostrea echinata]|uniref:uncharacterized protein LOC133173323 n=1 Tax=Saccostrea echinata TaxID=191078 RepID=UPI002A83F686|nr:uncharacterized protein LOC133173323 [Saccostrea echinata]